MIYYIDNINLNKINNFVVFFELSITMCEVKARFVILFKFFYVRTFRALIAFVNNRSIFV